jgi:hypothetical protein
MPVLFIYIYLCPVLCVSVGAVNHDVTMGSPWVDYILRSVNIVNCVVKPCNIVPWRIS